MINDKSGTRNLTQIHFVRFWLKLIELHNIVNEVSLIWYLKMVNFQYTCYIKRGYDG